MTRRPATTPFATRKQILLVEDSGQVRQVLARALEAENYTVHQAEHGQAGLAALKRATPDLILSDINMPRMNGIEFYKAVRQNPAWVPIPFIFLTANDSAEDIQAGRELGVEDYLTKPIEGDDLVRIVNARLLRVANVQIAQIGQAYLDTVTMLANAIEGRDPYTRGHVERVTAYSLRMAEAMRWSTDNIRNLEFGARLHDIGKVIIPDNILKKAGPLSDEEWALMKQHPTAGAKIVGGITHLQGTLNYILYHHEHWDGGGYPRGLAAQEIPLEGRLLALADVYDALTTVRPYHPARSPAEVAQFMKIKSGALFDPSLVPIFLEVMGLSKKA